MANIQDEEIKKMIAAAKEEGRAEGRAEGIEEGRAEWIMEIKAISKKLDEGRFFTPIDEVWKSGKASLEECNGCFRKIWREIGYYKTVEDYEKIVKDAQPAPAAVNPVLEAQAVIEAQKRHNIRGKTKIEKKKKKGRRRSLKEEIVLDGVEEHSESSSWTNSAGGTSSPSTSSGLGLENSDGDTETGGSQSTYDSQDYANPDFNGKIPSMRAHLAPASYSRYPFAISCQAVCGVDLVCQECDIRRFADGMVMSDTNFLRAPGIDGKMFDTTPCWIFVPLVNADVLKNWKKGEGYEVLAIAGGFGAFSSQVAYRCLCTKHYDDSGEIKRSKCSGPDLRLAKDLLTEMVMALSDSLVSTDAGISPLKFLEAAVQEGGKSAKSAKVELDMLRDTVLSIENNGGVFIPELKTEDENELGDIEVFKFLLDIDKMDYVPDPMLLLIKAAINWSWRCGQKLLPACGPVLEEEEDQEVSVTTPIPDVITCSAVPVTPDSDQKWPDEDWTYEDWTS